MWTYIAFGLTLKSELELPELLAASQAETYDVLITKKPPQAITNELQQTIQPNKVQLVILNVAAYSIEAGQSITLTPDLTASREDINLFLLGSVMGILLQQRDRLLLHACAIEHQGQAHLFAADSGVGKSTLAYGLYQRGYRVLTDDVACITNVEGQPIIHPGYPRLRLTQASSKALNADTTRAPTLVTCDKKYILSCREKWQTTPLPVASFNVIEPGSSDSIQHNEITGLDKLMQLKHHTYRYGYLDAQQKLATHFKQISQFSQTVSVSRINRPSDQFKIQELICFIEKEMQAQCLPV